MKHIRMIRVLRKKRISYIDRDIFFRYHMIKSEYMHVRRFNDELNASYKSTWR